MAEKIHWSMAMKMTIGGVILLFTVIGGVYGYFAILDSKYAHADDVKMLEKNVVISIEQLNKRFEIENKERIIRRLSTYRRLVARGEKLDAREKEDMADLELQLEALEKK